MTGTKRLLLVALSRGVHSESRARDSVRNMRQMPNCGKPLAILAVGEDERPKKDQHNLKHRLYDVYTSMIPKRGIDTYD